MSRSSIPLPVRVTLLGVLSGARSFTPLATLALYRGRRSLRGSWQGWPVFRSSAARTALVLGALGELVGDKLPATPSRTTPLPLLGRIVTGAIAGAALGTTGGSRAVRSAALLGAVGAVVGSFAGRYLRAGGAATGIPDAVFALIEDAATVACAAAVVAAD